ncbi:hypothetical protein BVRB_030330 [Beta vulgaris subsp. vulgaris]|uniref:Signal recognition particle 14 kDa protein n=1 Tax=Beta vulgaris subsp. vulgaris TaxID=3555 RepID=A0A0J8B0Y9_BETVV|nr:hypothetical protein BVRB_030330 [Beta vulgaris subsp. vulgaris]
MKSETESDHVCLIRVKVGQKRANVMVPFEEHARFQTNIANLLRVYLDGLKKRDKSETQNKTRSRRVA